MAEDFVQVNVVANPGDKLKAFKTTDGNSAVVKAQAVVLTEGTGGAEIPLQALLEKLIGKTGTATVSRVTANAASVTIFADNPDRLGAVIVNESLATLYIKYGATASLTDYSYQLGPGATWEMPARPFFTGVIDGIWDAATGAAQCTEL